MSIFDTTEDIHASAGVNEIFDDRDDDFDFDETGDQPLNRPKVEFTPTRDPLVAALFGPVGYSHSENMIEQECGAIS